VPFPAVDWRGYPDCDKSQISINQTDKCKKIIFVHIGKAGGSAIASLFYSADELADLVLMPPLFAKYNGGTSFKAASWFHVSARHQRAWHGTDLYNDAISFAVVRNPYSLMLSWFFFWFNLCYPTRFTSLHWFFLDLTNQGLDHGTCSRYQKMSSFRESDPHFVDAARKAFVDFVDFWPQHASNGFGDVLMTQFDMLRGDDDEGIIVDMVVRIEGSEYQDFVSRDSILNMACGRHGSTGSSLLRAKANPSSHCENFFFYYTQKSCDTVADYWKGDFEAFGYDMQECHKEMAQSCSL